jgi:PHD/YefM family antitoxin component YafN of YafNO toxin-antitoxin module
MVRSVPITYERRVTVTWFPQIPPMILAPGVMMHTPVTTTPVARVESGEPEIFEHLKEAPLLLTRQGEDAGVLIHPDAWRQLVADLKRYKRLARIERARREMDAGNFLTGQQVEALLKADGLLP